MSGKHLDIETHSEGPVTVLTLSGDVDASNHVEFEEALRGACGGSAPRVVLDCENLRYLNSRSFGLLFKYQAKSAEAGGKLVTCRVSRKILGIMSILGLDEYLENHETPDAARKAVQSG